MPGPGPNRTVASVPPLSSPLPAEDADSCHPVRPWEFACSVDAIKPRETQRVFLQVIRMCLAKVALLLLPFIATTHGVHVGAFYMICQECGPKGEYISRARGVCSNLCFAVASGLKPDRLTITDNRNADLGCSACRNRSPCGASCDLAANYKKTGDTCDEYPFASTRESGRSTGNPAVLRCVPGVENSSGGGQYRSFKAHYSVGDTFDVGVSLHDGLQFCSPFHGINDGAEFRYFGGGRAHYQNPRRDLVVNDARFVAAEARNATIPVIPSVYKTNHSDLFIAFKHLDVGTPTWNVRDGWGNVTEKVHENAFIYSEKYQQTRRSTVPINKQPMC